VKALLREHAPLGPLTTLGIGGPARYLLEAPTEKIVLEAIRFAADRELPLFILGGGSNLLVSDRGFPGLVLKVALKGIDWETGRDSHVVVHAGAGEDWDRLVGLCVERRLAGIECLSGIPGSVGGTPVQNVGAYGQDVSEVLLAVRAVDRRSGEVVELSQESCGFTYRTSIFNTTAKDRYVVLKVLYTLKKDGLASVRYPDVQREFQAKASSPTVAEVRAAVRRIRAGKAMLLVEGDPDCRSAGSFFKNPILNEKDFSALEALFPGERVPRYSVTPGKTKTAAAWLIERAGFSRGYSIGPAGLSSKHTLALINKGGASAEDVLRLAREIRVRVLDKFGVRLEPEPVFLGFDPQVLSEFFPW
jgi:UDP-N-acetylmuramate dehydrogenase